jgi:hypothetical protein
MRLHAIVFVFVVVGLSSSLACKDNGGEPPTPPPTTTIIEPPPPPPERKPEDYITRSRGARIVRDVDVESRSDIYLSIWSGIRDEEYAAQHCASLVAGVLGLTPDQLIDMGNEGRDLLRAWESKWRGNLSTVNKRCETDEQFCGRTNVLKKNWDPYVERLRAHRTKANRNRALAQLDPQADCDFDSVEGWCRCRNGGLN